MLRISKLTDYSLLVMDYLADRLDAVVSAKEIAQQTQLSLPTVSKLLKILLEAGLLTSERGAGGGYQLSRSADDISIAEIISAVEGIPSLTECSHGNSCSQDKICRLKGNWRVINQMVMSVLGEYSLTDMSQPMSDCKCE